MIGRNHGKPGQWGAGHSGSFGEMQLKKQIALVALWIALAGCSKITAENYAKLQTGMTQAEVNAILGKPDSCDETMGFKSCRWGDDKSHVTVRFVADKLMLNEAVNIR